MARKRKAAHGRPPPKTHFAADETFNDSEDEFYAARDKVLLEEEPASKRRRQQQQDLELSDEEVYGDQSTTRRIPGGRNSASSQDESEDENGDEDEDEDGYWGTSKEDYYNADVIETEADALEEEAEARRLHQKQLKGMKEADFGFDELDWTEAPRSTVEKLSFQIPEDATVEEKVAILRSRYPEFGPLTDDFLNLYAGHKDLTGTKRRALTAYLASIAMYLLVLSSAKEGAMAPTELHNHPIMDSILKCRQLWEQVKDLEDDDSASPDESTVPEAAVSNAAVQKIASKPEAASTLKKMPKSIPVPPAPAKSKSDKRSIEGSHTAKKARKSDLRDLLEKVTVAEDESDFGDERPLTVEEAAEKDRKKKSLRFYTSQIAQKSNKRGAASRHAGGDDDIPHKERLRDKQVRLMREAEQRGKGADLDLDLGGSDVEEQRNDEGNEYYDLLVSNSKQKKADKKTKAEAYAEAAKQGGQVYEEEQVGADGKRKITYAIEKNKGLAPKREKDVRNPRVKKRKKFDEKMKKLGSIRQVYKGGEGRGGYGGELTGIKTNVVKSIKL